MFIKSIDWMDEERREAIVIVSDMENEIKCFADGLKYNVGDVLVDPLNCLTTKNVFRSYENKTFIDNKRTCFSYRVIGRLIDKSNGLVQIGDISLHISPELIPGDIERNEQIEFETDRIDL